MKPFNLLIKPSGSDCNLDCGYCFYKDRPREVGTGRQRMSDEVLETLVRDYLKLGFAESQFAWQGGEPALMGLDFYRRAVEQQKKYLQPGKTVTNAFQTNAVLLDDQWYRFFAENNFLVGISIDGPQEMHDKYRLDHADGGTYQAVMAAIENCKKHKVQFNTLTLLNKINVEHPDELFAFFEENRIKYLQFIPCVETNPKTGEIADFSITPEQYGRFLCRMFDLWYPRATQISIRNFDSFAWYCAIGRGAVCTFDRKCAGYIVIEHNGDAFCCDFFVTPQWKLGSIMKTPIEKLADSELKREFVDSKQRIANKCLVCRYLDACRGGCLKDRLPLGSITGKESYFCQSYKKFFDHAMPRLQLLGAKLRERNQES